jgi:aryl-alcohol dehydrogenase-like predicted oxidoreductase
VLTGKYRNGLPADSRGASPHFEHFVAPYLNDRCAGIVEAVITAAAGLGTSPLEVALAWVRDRPGVTAAVLGARSVGQLVGALRSEAVELPAEIQQALDDVSAQGEQGATAVAQAEQGATAVAQAEQGATARGWRPGPSP